MPERREQGRTLIERQNRVKQEAIGNMLDLLQVDEDWVQRHDDGFTWWAHEHAQRFRVDGPYDVSGEPTYWLLFETDLLESPLPGDAGLARVAQGLNARSYMYTAAVFDNKLVLRGRTSFTRANLYLRTKMVAERALIANVMANTKAESVLDEAKMLAHEGSSLELAQSHHPESGPRAKRDAMLGTLRAIREQGARPLPRDRLLNLEELRASMSGKAESISLNKESTALYLSGEVAGATYNFRIDHGVRHPEMGGGVFSMLQILYEYEPGKPAVRELVTELNDAEWTTSEPMLGLGSWGVYARVFISRLYLAYGRFSPNATVEPSLGTATLADLELRLGWLEEWLKSRKVSLH